MTVFSHITNPHGFPVNEKSRRLTIADVRDGKVGVVSVAHALLIAHSSLAPVPPPLSTLPTLALRAPMAFKDWACACFTWSAKKFLWVAWFANFAVAMIWVLCAIVLSKHLDGLYKKLPESDDAAANLVGGLVSTSAWGIVLIALFSIFSLVVLLRGVRRPRPSHPPSNGTDPPAEVTFKPTPTTSLSRAVFPRVFPPPLMSSR